MFSVLFVACSGHTKKVIVYANNEADINDQTKTITQKDNEGHLDKEIQFNTGDKVTIKIIQKEGSTANIDIPEDGYYILNAKAKDTIVAAGGNFNGNEEAGGFDINTFAGKIEGAYTILNDEINVNITKKPMFVPCSEIENQLRKYLE